jgi:hypothetical protein
MPLKYRPPYLPIDNVGKKRRDWAYLVPVEDGKPKDPGMPRMRDVFNNFTCERTGDGKLVVKGPFTEGYYMFWVYGDLNDYPVWKHFHRDRTLSMAHPRHDEFASGKWREPGPVVGPIFFNQYGLDGKPPFIRVSGDAVSGGDNLLTFDLKEMKEGRFNGEYLFQITKPGVTEVVLDGSEMWGLSADTITLEPIDLEERHRIKLKPLPERVKTHPRLYFDAGELEHLRKERNTNANARIYKELWDSWIEKAIEGADTKDEGLWHPEGRERIFETDRLVLCAFGYLMEADERCLKAAVEALEQIIADDYEWPVVDNHVAMVMGAIQTGYDWLYHALTDDERKRTESVMAARAEEGYRMKLVDRYYRQNHYMTTTYFSVGVTAFLLWEKMPEEVERWGAFARTSLERTLALCPDDGSWQGLWNYEMVSLVPFVEMLRQMTGEDMFQRESFFRNTGHFWLQRKRGDWRWHEGWDGSGRQTQNECPWIYKFAAASQDPVLQWAADGIRPILLDKSDWRFAQPQRRVFEYLWRDPDLKPDPPTQEDLSRHFSDGGITFMRNGWEKESIVFDTRCGPRLGHTALSQGELSSYGHPPQNMNTIHLYAYGEGLLSGRTGGCGTMTLPCSTVIIDGCGQDGEGSFFGEGAPVMPRRTAYARHFIHADDYDYVEGVATTSYPKELKLTNFTRRILYLRPDLFVIVDELAAEEPRLFQWRLSTEGQFRIGDERGRFTLEKGTAALDILVALPPHWTSVLGEVPLSQGYCSDLAERVNYLGIEAPHKVFETTFVTLLAPRRLEQREKRPRASVKRDGDDLGVTVAIGKRKWVVTFGSSDETEKRVEVS